MKLTTSSIVKKFAVISLAVAGVCGTNRAFADDVAPATVSEAAVYQARSIDDIQQLTGPIALYPDALLAQVLVASTYPNDVLAAAKYLQEGGDPAADCGCGWDASVRGLLQTPDVLNQLAGNVDWMNQLGETFLNQQQDVFTAVQSLRLKARTCGNLVSTDQCRVIVAENAIQILPANPQIIYVPRYNPRVVFFTPHIDLVEPCVSFDAGVQVGMWLQTDFDWHDRCVYTGNWGVERPWWRHEDGIDQGDYVHSRPGTYVNNETNITNVRNTTINNTHINRVSAWNHDGNKPAPRHVDGPAINHVSQVTPAKSHDTSRRIENSWPRSPVSTSVRKHAAAPMTPTELTNRLKSNSVKIPSMPIHASQPSFQPKPNVANGPFKPARPAQPTFQPKSNVANAPTSPVHTAQRTLQPKSNVVKAPTQTVHATQPACQPKPLPTMQSHAAQPNPVRLPVSNPVPTQAPRAAAMATPRTTSAPAVHSTPATHRSQSASNGSLNGRTQRG